MRHREQPDHPRGLPAPHHQRLARRLPGAPDRGPARRRRRARPRRLPGDADRHALDPGPRDRAPARRGCARATSARRRRSSGCAAGTGAWSPDSVEATIYQAFTLPLRPRGRPRGDRRPRPLRALARPRRQRLHEARQLALALAVAPARALGGGRRGADRPRLGRAGARLRCAARSTSSASASATTSRAGAGARARARVPARARRGQPAAGRSCSTAGSRSAAARRRSPRSAGTRTTPTTRSGRRAWRIVADPADPDRSRWQAFTGQSGHVASPHYDDLQPRWVRRSDAADGRRRARGASCSSEPRAGP